MALKEFRQSVGRLFAGKVSHIETPTVFVDAILNKERFMKLPFDIEVTNGGYRLTRLGAPLIEDDGTRVFIVGKNDLDNFYKVNQNNGHSPEALYSYLKDTNNNRLGKLLARGEDSVDIDPEKMKDYYLIVKKVDHETKRRWSVPDGLRLEFSPEKGFTQIEVERVWNDLPEGHINLTGATANVASLRIKEPWYLTESDKQEWHDFLIRGGYKQAELDDLEEKRDYENNLFKPNTNTLSIRSLREHQGVISAPAIEVDIYKNEKGELIVRITRNSGVDGIFIEGTAHFLKDEEYLDVSLIQPNMNRSTLQLFFNAESDSLRRGALKLSIIREKNGQISADFLSGVTEIPIPEYNPSAGIIKSLTAKELELRRQIEERERLQKQTELKRKQKIALGTSINLFTRTKD